MDELLDFVGRHGRPVIFAVIFFDQVGLPMPSVPILLAFGALAGIGEIDPVQGLVLGVVASVCADLIWFQLGRWKGSRVLGFLCRIALEPDLCVSKTHEIFARHGLKSLLVAKFVPGFDTVAPPLAGMLGGRVLPFVLWSAAGALLWLLVFCGLGYVFSDQLEELARQVARFGSAVGLVLLGLLGLYLAYKYVARRRVLVSLRTARITPEELHELIVNGKEPVILDARGQTDLELLPFTIERAQAVSLESVDRTTLELLLGKEVIVYCA